MACVETISENLHKEDLNTRKRVWMWLSVKRHFVFIVQPRGSHISAHALIDDLFPAVPVVLTVKIH